MQCCFDMIMPADGSGVVAIVLMDTVKVKSVVVVV